jgi:hypothetical protein
MDMDMQATGSARADMKTVYAITERGGRSFWTKVGVGFTNRDGSINLKLDAIPVSGQLQVREYEDPRRFAPPSPGTELRGRAPRDEMADPLA